MFESFHVAALAQYAPHDSGITGIVILVTVCGFVAYGVTEASKAGVKAFMVPADKRDLWRWVWRGISILAATLIACGLNHGFDLVFALIGAASGAGNAVIVAVAFSLAKKQVAKRAPPEVGAALAKIEPPLSDSAPGSGNDNTA